MQEIKNINIDANTFQMVNDMKRTSYFNHKIVSISDDSWAIAFMVENSEWDEAFDRKELASIYTSYSIEKELASEGIERYIWVEGEKKIVGNDMSQLIHLLSLVDKKNLLELSNSLNENSYFKLIVADLILAYSHIMEEHSSLTVVEKINANKVSFTEQKLNQDWEKLVDNLVDNRAFTYDRAMKLAEKKNLRQYDIVKGEKSIEDYGFNKLLEDIYVLDNPSIKKLFKNTEHSFSMQKNIIAIYRLKQKMLEKLK